MNKQITDTPAMCPVNFYLLTSTIVTISYIAIVVQQQYNWPRKLIQYKM